MRPAKSHIAYCDSFNGHSPSAHSDYGHERAHSRRPDDDTMIRHTELVNCPCAIRSVGKGTTIDIELLGNLRTGGHIRERRGRPEKIYNGSLAAKASSIAEVNVGLHSAIGHWQYHMPTTPLLSCMKIWFLTVAILTTGNKHTKQLTEAYHHNPPI